MKDDVAWIVIIVGALLVLIGRVLAERARRRAIERRMQSGLPNIVDGEIVTLVGRVRPVDRHLEAPLTGRKCVAFEARVRIYDDDLAGRLRLRQTIVTRAMVRFELVTAEGSVLVEGDSAELALPPVPLIPRRIEREVAFLEARGYDASYARTAGFDEMIVGEGDKVAVYGRATVRRGSEPVARIRLVAYDNPLTIGAAP